VRLAALLPRSTTWQVGLVIAMSSLLAHLAFLGLWFAVARPGPSPDAEAAASEIALLARLHDALPIAAVADLNGGRAPGELVVWPTDRPPDAAPGARLDALRLDVQDRLGGAWQVAPAPEPAGDAPVVLRAPDGAWMSVRPKPGLAVRRSRSPPPPVFLLLVIGVPLALASLWAARRVTAPLERLARAADALGLAGQPSPLPEDGTLEIRKLAQAFNALLGRLHGEMADRTRMLTAISHDLRTPLTRLRLRAEGLEEPGMRGKLLRDVEAMEVMTRSTLSFLEQQSHQEDAEAVDVAALAQTVCDDFADGGADVAYEGPRRCVARAQPRALERALTNLVENAAKFGDRVTVRLACEADRATIDVDDDGPGIPDGEKANVLKPFYRTDQARGAATGGVGMGLAIAREVASAHGGDLTLHDLPPHGLRARLSLPFQWRVTEADSDIEGAGAAVRAERT
jgi:signal transduction histidine kinase